MNSAVGGSPFRGSQRPFNSGRSSRGRGFHQQNRGGQHYHAQIGNFGNSSHMGPFEHQLPQHYQHQQQFYAPQLPPMGFPQSFNPNHSYQLPHQYHMGQHYYPQQQNQAPLQNLDLEHGVSTGADYPQTDSMQYGNDSQMFHNVGNSPGVAYSSEPSFQYGQNYPMQQSFYRLPTMQIPQFAPMGYQHQQNFSFTKPAQKQLLDNVEIVFSPINLSSNERLRQMMDPHGFVPLIIVQSMPKIQEMGCDIAYLSQTLNQSQSLELSSDGLKVRPRKDWHIWVQKSNDVKMTSAKTGKEDVTIQSEAVPTSKCSLKSVKKDSVQLNAIELDLSKEITSVDVCVARLEVSGDKADSNDESVVIKDGEKEPRIGKTSKDILIHDEAGLRSIGSEIDQSSLKFSDSRNYFERMASSTSGTNEFGVSKGGGKGVKEVGDDVIKTNSVSTPDHKETHILKEISCDVGEPDGEVDVAITVAACEVLDVADDAGEVTPVFCVEMAQLKEVVLESRAADSAPKDDLNSLGSALKVAKKPDILETSPASVNFPRETSLEKPLTDGNNALQDIKVAESLEDEHQNDEGEWQEPKSSKQKVTSKAKISAQNNSTAGNTPFRSNIGRAAGGSRFGGGPRVIPRNHPR